MSPVEKPTQADMEAIRKGLAVADTLSSDVPITGVARKELEAAWTAFHRIADLAADQAARTTTTEGERIAFALEAEADRKESYTGNIGGAGVAVVRAQASEYRNAARLVRSLATPPATPAGGGRDRLLRVLIDTGAPDGRGGKYIVPGELVVPLADAILAALSPSPAAAPAREFVLEWIGAARPPVHPDPMKGRQAFATLEGAVAFMRRQPADATFVRLTEFVTQSFDRGRALDLPAQATPSTPKDQ